MIKVKINAGTLIIGKPYDLLHLQWLKTFIGTEQDYLWLENNNLGEGLRVLGTLSDIGEATAKKLVESGEEEGQYEYPTRRPFVNYMDYELGCYGDNDFKAQDSLRSLVQSKVESPTINIFNLILILKKMTNEEIREKVFQDCRAERERQLAVEGFTEEHDDKHKDGELGDAAAHYAAVETPYRCDTNVEIFPWDKNWDKKDNHERYHQLEIASGLISAEMERILRAERDNTN